MRGLDFIRYRFSHGGNGKAAAVFHRFERHRWQRSSRFLGHNFLLLYIQLLAHKRIILSKRYGICKATLVSVPPSKATCSKAASSSAFPQMGLVAMSAPAGNEQKGKKGGQNNVTFLHDCLLTRCGVSGSDVSAAIG